ncbi:hypothetical protein [Rhizobium bangladeshense]|nr:hypothetical protein [Rhizobium bangladeshense]MBX4930366.1 hypothetical protein [Rhizobium bangladeshense]MBY3581335.1 hypothetical protein [Rhizobium bangladeshense]QSY87399.1 hypothetical protein J2J98_14455 [Rhizobium bangladeshense]
MTFLRMTGEKQDFPLPERGRREEDPSPRSLSEEEDVFQQRRLTARVIKL